MPLAAGGPGGAILWPVWVDRLTATAACGDLAVLTVADLEDQTGCPARHLILGTWEGPNGFRESELELEDGAPAGAHLENWYQVTLAGIALLAARGCGRILVLGLGGGGVTAFLARHSPRSRLEAVELCPEVVDAARSHFGLPGVDQLTTHVGDAGAFVAAAEPGTYDVILVDVYTSGIFPPSLATEAFFQTLRKAVAAGGTVAVNAGADEAAAALRGTFQAVFGAQGKALVDPVDAENVVLVAGATVSPAEWGTVVTASRQANATSNIPDYPFGLESVTQMDGEQLCVQWGAPTEERIEQDEVLSASAGRKKASKQGKIKVPGNTDTTGSTPKPGNDPKDTMWDLFD
ncbi:hypothetical protein CYMTET_18024 [Cymbomonas tetramitiformis]|uniref:PABS domain-containing protein n=1 Tax=Cymbomonas tetramitiformis TaxID=36881 RepID=A0AAE0G9B7_9CHLO|nr:hypothetical protein CYMTET_18024 [Cymbomonas tetramitiformis]